MHLIKKCHGLKGVLSLLDKKYREPLVFLQSIKEKLEVCTPKLISCLHVKRYKISKNNFYAQGYCFIEILTIIYSKL